VHIVRRCLHLGGAQSLPRPAPSVHRRCDTGLSTHLQHLVRVELAVVDLHLLPHHLKALGRDEALQVLTQAWHQVGVIHYAHVLVGCLVDHLGVGAAPVGGAWAAVGAAAQVASRACAPASHEQPSQEAVTAVAHQVVTSSGHGAAVGERGVCCTPYSSGWATGRPQDVHKVSITTTVAAKGLQLTLRHLHLVAEQQHAGGAAVPIRHDAAELWAVQREAARARVVELCARLVAELRAQCSDAARTRPRAPKGWARGHAAHSPLEHAHQLLAALLGHAQGGQLQHLLEALPIQLRRATLWRHWQQHASGYCCCRPWGGQEAAACPV